MSGLPGPVATPESAGAPGALPGTAAEPESARPGLPWAEPAGSAGPAVTIAPAPEAQWSGDLSLSLRIVLSDTSDTQSAALDDQDRAVGRARRTGTRAAGVADPMAARYRYHSMGSAKRNMCHHPYSDSLASPPTVPFG